MEQFIALGQLQYEKEAKGGYNLNRLQIFVCVCTFTSSRLFVCLFECFLQFWCHSLLLLWLALLFVSLCCITHFYDYFLLTEKEEKIWRKIEEMEEMEEMLKTTKRRELNKHVM